MKNLKKIALFFTILVTSFSLVACKGKKSEVSIENVFPKESSFVFVVDYSDTDQIENFRDIISRFPDTGLWKKMAQAFGSGSGFDLEPFSWEEDFKPVFDGKWKIGFTMTFPEDFKSLEDFDKFEPEDAGFYVAGEFSESDKIRALIEKASEEEASDFGKLKYEEIDGVEYWSDPKSDNGYLVAYGDVFFLTWSRADVDSAVKRIKEGGGFGENERFALANNSLGGDNLGYAFYSDRIFELYADAFSELGLNFDDLLEGFGDSLVLVSAESEGFRLGTSMGVDKDSKIAKFIVPDQDYKLSLIKKINGDGVFYYSETGGIADGSVDLYLNLWQQILKNSALFNESASGAGADLYFDPASLQTSALISPTDSPAIIDDSDVFTGVESAIDGSQGSPTLLRALSGDIVQRVIDFAYDVEVLLESPGAFAMSDIGTYLPTAALYFQIDEKDLVEVKELVIKLDAYVDSLIVEVDRVDGIAGLVKKDVEILDGAALHKLSLDLTILSEQEGVGLGMFLAIVGNSLKLEAYYGLTSDNVFVIALYPDFAKAYGENVLAGNKDFKKAVGSLGDIYGSSISYFRTKPVLDFADRILSPGVAFGAFTAKDKQLFDLYGRRLVGTIEYIISSTVVNDQGLLGTSFFRIKEVKVEE